MTKCREVGAIDPLCVKKYQSQDVKTNTEIKERDAQRHMTFKHLNKQKHSMSSLSKYEGIRNSAEIQYFDQTIVYDTKKAAGVSGNKYAKQPDYHKLNLHPMQYRSNSNNAKYS